MAATERYQQRTIELDKDEIERDLEVSSSAVSGDVELIADLNSSTIER